MRTAKGNEGMNAARLARRWDEAHGNTVAMAEALADELQADLVTKADLAAAVSEIRAEMQSLLGEFGGELHSQGGELRTEVQALRGDLRAEIHSQGGELRTEMQALRGDLRAEIHSQGGELRTEMQALRGDLRAEIHSQGGTLIRWTAGLLLVHAFGVAGVVVGLVRLLG